MTTFRPPPGKGFFIAFLLFVSSGIVLFQNIRYTITYFEQSGLYSESALVLTIIINASQFAMQYALFAPEAVKMLFTKTELELDSAVPPHVSALIRSLLVVLVLGFCGWSFYVDCVSTYEILSGGDVTIRAVSTAIFVFGNEFLSIIAHYVWNVSRAGVIAMAGWDSLMEYNEANAGLSNQEKGVRLQGRQLGIQDRLQQLMQKQQKQSGGGKN